MYFKIFKIFMALSMINFIKYIKPKLLQPNAKKWWCFQCSVYYYKFGFKNAKMGEKNAKMGTKMSKLVIFCSNLFPINWCFKHQNNILGAFMQIKNVGFKAFMKLPYGSEELPSPLKHLKGFLQFFETLITWILF